MYYVLKQTHEPILRKDDGQNYTSRILSRWSRNIDYTQYTLCPSPSLRFNENNPFPVTMFQSHLSAITRQFDPDFSLTQKDRCSIVRFPKPRKSFLEFLTLYENAPTFKESDKLEIGLGPFYVKKIGSEEIILARKKPVGNGYNEISLYEYHGPADSRLHSEKIKDFNFIPDFDVPGWVRRDYASFKNVELKSEVLIINHPDINIRKIIYECVDVQKLRQAFFPKKNNFYDISNILPTGIPGAKSGLPPQTCGGRSTQAGHSGPLVFANWMNGNDEELRRFASDFSAKTGLQLKIVNFVPTELVKAFNSKTASLQSCGDNV